MTAGDRRGRRTVIIGLVLTYFLVSTFLLLQYRYINKLKSNFFHLDPGPDPQSFLLVYISNDRHAHIWYGNTQDVNRVQQSAKLSGLYRFHAGNL